MLEILEILDHVLGRKQTILTNQKLQPGLAQLHMYVFNGILIEDIILIKNLPLQNVQKLN
jgi:hypothetical protein